MSERVLNPVDSIIGRWPGIADNDVEQAADFMEYCLGIDRDELRTTLASLRADDPRSELIADLVRIADWDLAQKDVRDRQEILAYAARTVFRHEQDNVLEALQSGDEALAKTTMDHFVSRWPFEVQVEYEPSPLIPDGRTINIPVDIASGQKVEAPDKSKYVVDCNGIKEEVKKAVVDYIDQMDTPSEPEQNQAGAIRELAEASLTFDTEQHQALRQTYGTKAANLLVFTEALGAFNNAAREKYNVSKIIVPRFTVAPVALYRMYKNADARYDAFLEQIRQQAIEVSSDRYDPELFRPLVAVRSSAVNSEDGDKASGAGIYKSTIADPRDPQSFRDAVQAVFESMDSEQAKSYQKELGIEDDLMGLVIQQYIEGVRGEFGRNSTFGYIQSHDASGRFMELSTRLGGMVYDRAKVEDTFMVIAPFGRVQPTWHYVPDHNSDIANFHRQGTDVANAAMFAEKLFGKPVEVEFVISESRGAYIVQIRPIPNYEAVLPEVTFPEDVEPLVECRALGVCDIIATVRDDGNYQKGETRIDWIETEDHKGADAWSRDKDTVQIIGYNDGYSGHIQMQAKERGQICLYPDSGTRLPSGISRRLTDNFNSNGVRKFRIVADGHRGAIYPLEEDYAEEAEKKILLQRTLHGLSALALQKAQDTKS